MRVFGVRVDRVVVVIVIMAVRVGVVMCVIVSVLGFEAAHTGAERVAEFAICDV